MGKACGPAREAPNRITACELIAPYSLRLCFNDGLARTIDFEAILEGELYGPLRDPAAFAQVTLDSEIHTVVWPCGADFDPATLHDWPEHEAAFRAAAEQWSHTNAKRLTVAPRHVVRSLWES